MPFSNALVFIPAVLRRGARLVLGDRDRRELRPVHALEGDEVRSESTTATFIFQSCFFASATAAAMSASARSSEIGAP